jgi:hypothetical protein
LFLLDFSEEELRKLHPLVHSAHLRGPRQVSAGYNKGVLKITFAKKADAQPKQIKST